MTAFPPVLLGASTKMYFSHESTVHWCRAVAAIARLHPATQDGHAGLFVVPGYLSIAAAREALGDLAMVGGQDLATDDFGPYTGEVSGAQLGVLPRHVVNI